MSDVTLAALRGTVDFGKFVSPYTLKRPFGICTEFGQIVGGNADIVQKLLNVLEEGVVTVSLAKITSIGADQIHDIEADFGIRFIDSNTFTYSTNWVMMAATYNRKFLVDNAFESRFSIIIPRQKLDNKLTKHIVESKPFVVDETAVETLRELVFDSGHQMDNLVKLPEEVYSEELTVRDSAQMLSTVLCRKWWGIDTTNDEIVQMSHNLKQTRDNIWKSATDRVFDCIESEGKTLAQIMQETGLQKRQVYLSLKDLRAIRDFKEGELVYRVF